MLQLYECAPIFNPDANPKSINALLAETIVPITFAYFFFFNAVRRSWWSISSRWLCTRLGIYWGSDIHRWWWLWISMHWERSSSWFSRSSLWFIPLSPRRKRSLERRESRRWTMSLRRRRRQQPLTENVDPPTSSMPTPTLSSSVLASPVCQILYHAKP